MPRSGALADGRQAHAPVHQFRPRGRGGADAACRSPRHARQPPASVPARSGRATVPRAHSSSPGATARGCPQGSRGAPQGSHPPGVVQPHRPLPPSLAQHRQVFVPPDQVETLHMRAQHLTDPQPSLEDQPEQQGVPDLCSRNHREDAPGLLPAQPSRTGRPGRSRRKENDRRNVSVNPPAEAGARGQAYDGARPVSFPPQGPGSKDGRPGSAPGGARRLDPAAPVGRSSPGTWSVPPSTGVRPEDQTLARLHPGDRPDLARERQPDGHSAPSSVNMT